MLSYFEHRLTTKQTFFLFLLFAILFNFGTLDQIAFIGDDLNDTEALRRVGFSATPEDGAIQNKKIVDYICKKRGGEGCVREICDLILST